MTESIALLQSELAGIQPQLEELVAARALTDRYGSYRSSGDKREDQRNGLDYEDARESEEAVVAGVVQALDEADDSTISPPHKVIVKTIIDHVWRRPMDESLGIIKDGFAIYDRVAEDIANNRGTLAVVNETEGYIGLYESEGQEDIDIAHTHDRSQRVTLSVTGGKVVITNPSSSEFPHLTVQANVTQAWDVLNGQAYSAQPWHHLETFDPSSDRYKLPFVRLGTPERPLASLDNLLTTDAARFAGRLLIVTLGKQKWLTVRPPSETVSAQTIDEFAKVYTEVLTGMAPSDTEEHIRLEGGLGGVHLARSHQRRRSLASYSVAERTSIFYAANITASDIEEATREKLAKLELSNTAETIAKALHAKLVVDQFFAKI